MTIKEKITALKQACENTNLAYDTEHPLSQYPWAFKGVESTEELLMHLNEDYSIRNGFLCHNLAMVQQINGGNEWLTLRLDENAKEYTPIESISFARMQSKYPVVKSKSPRYPQHQMKLPRTRKELLCKKLFLKSITTKRRKALLSVYQQGGCGRKIPQRMDLHHRCLDHNRLVQKEKKTTKDRAVKIGYDF